MQLSQRSGIISCIDLIFLFVLLSDFTTFSIFSSSFSYQVSFSIHYFSGWYVCHHSTSFYAILSHLRLWFTLHQITSVYSHLSHRADQLSFTAATNVVYGSSSPSPPTLRNASLFPSCFILFVVIGSPTLFPLSSSFFIVVWLLPTIYRSIFPSSFVFTFDAGVFPLRFCALLWRRLRLCIPIAPVLL